MSLYVKIDRATGAELERQDLGDDPGRALAKAQVWLPLVIATRPPYEEKTQTVTPRLVVPDLSDLEIPVPEDAQAILAWDVVTVPPPPAPETTPTTIEDLERLVLGLFPSKTAAAAALALAKQSRGKPM